MERPFATNQENTFTLTRKRSGVLSGIDAVKKPFKQYLYFAFRRSLRDAEDYENAASGFPANDERTVFFRELANRKREEAESLYLYYKSDGYRMVKAMRKRSIISLPHYRTGEDSSRISSIEDSYSFAYKKEQNSLNLFSKLASLDRNPYTKSLFDYLTALQTDHIVFIEKKVSGTDYRMPETRLMAAS